MLKKEIKVGGRYLAKVSDRVTVVRVLEIRETTRYAGIRARAESATVYDVVNERTGRRTTFRSAAKFRKEAPAAPGAAGAEAEDRREPDPRTPLRVTTLKERYNGVETGLTAYHAEVAEGCHPLGGVLGRGYSEAESVLDFLRRARADGHAITDAAVRVAERRDLT